MATLNPSLIDSWHAHVYFDASSRDAARALREIIERELTGRVDLGRFHEKPVGPHPMWSYQLAFPAANFHAVVSWLALNHDALDVFIHPNTGDELRDHRDCALWLGRSHVLNLAALVE
jgi:aromatic ring-cleaving dioxygenase